MEPPGREAFLFLKGVTMSGDPASRAVLAPPRGFRDILPTEARELRAIERSLTGTFASYGYMPLEPPTLERAEGDGILAGDRIIQFLDRDGALVSLRPDITTAVARLVAKRYGDASGALRLSYFAPVFREEPAMLGTEREYMQARAGLREHSIEIGHVGLVSALFDDLADDPRDEVMALLRRGDHVGAFARAHGA